MSTAARYDEVIQLPRAVRFPVELLVPEGFDPEDRTTWPRVDGRLEHVEGRLLFMPPCGDLQQDTVADIVIALGRWVRAHPDFVLGTNEAGMRLAGATRAADVAIWARLAAGPRTGGLRRTPPLLAVEVASQDEPAEHLREKADWYLRAGVQVSWVVRPDVREVEVITPTDRTTHRDSDVLPTCEALVALQVCPTEFFLQIAGG